MSVRILTPLLALVVANLLPAADRPEGEHQGPPGPPPGALFERFDHDGDHLLSRPEFVRGMIALRNHRGEAGGEPGRAGERPPRPPGDGERPPRPPGDGERPPKPHGDGERPPRPPGDGERPPKPHGDGERPAKPGDGERPPRPEGGGPLEAAFEKADADHSGGLSLEEFRAALQHMPRPPGQRPGDKGEGDGGRERPRPPKEN